MRQHLVTIGSKIRGALATTVPIMLAAAVGTILIYCFVWKEKRTQGIIQGMNTQRSQHQLLTAKIGINQSDRSGAVADLAGARPVRPVGPTGLGGIRL